MRWIDLLRMSSNSLKRRKLRTFLTVLGVVIGTASIVVMISLGLGLQESMYQEIEQSGGVTSLTVTGKEVFVGNIEPGATGSIDGIVTANQEMDETKKCKVVISYEDEAGKSASMEKEFPLTVTPAQNPADMMPVEAEAPDKGLPVVPIVIAVVVVAGIVTVVLLRRHKKKKMAALEEEDLLNEVDRFTEDE